jgi:hypothetical protein
VYVACSNYDDNDYGVRFLAQSSELAAVFALQSIPIRAQLLVNRFG